MSQENLNPEQTPSDQEPETAKEVGDSAQVPPVNDPDSAAPSPWDPPTGQPAGSDTGSGADYGSGGGGDDTTSAQEDPPSAPPATPADPRVEPTDSPAAPTEAPAEPVAPPASGEAAPAAPAPWPPAPEQEYPSAEEDAALREQRARRFGSPEPEGAYPAAEGAPGEPATQTFSAGPVAEQEEEADGPPPVVTPIPASPASPAFPDGQGSGTGPQPAVGQGQFPATTTQLPAAAPGVQAPQEYDDFEGFEEASLSRAAAHWWTVLITLVFAPVAWYLFTDGGARIEWASSQSQPITIASYIEFGLGLLAVFIFLLAARWSSVGAIVMGSVFLALGLAFLIFPGEGADVLRSSTEYFGRLGQFGINVVEHLSATLETGRMALYGLVLIMVGVVSHGARRQGRREERTRIALEG